MTWQSTHGVLAGRCEHSKQGVEVDHADAACWIPELDFDDYLFM